MNFLKVPNLPTKKIKYMIIDSRVEEDIKGELSALGISLIQVNECNALQKGVSAHPDLHIFHKGNSDFITSEFFYNEFNDAISCIKEIDCEDFNNRQLEEKFSMEYPYDVFLNVASVGEYIILNEKTVSKEIIENTTKKIIPTKQGYSKCSVAPITKNAIITDDISIYNSAKKYLDVLFVDHDNIKLNGYNYGFIGGCSGKISDKEIIFSGNVLNHKNGNDIIDFCNNHKIDVISMGTRDLYDYGSFLPIIE